MAMSAHIGMTRCISMVLEWKNVRSVNGAVLLMNKCRKGTL